MRSFKDIQKRNTTIIYVDGRIRASCRRLKFYVIMCTKRNEKGRNYIFIDEIQDIENEN